LEVKSLKRLFLRKSRHISLLGSWHVALKMWRMLKLFLLSYPVHSQIWLIFYRDDRQFIHITKMKKKRRKHWFSVPLGHFHVG
jgi:hypothetical protein